MNRSEFIIQNSKKIALAILIVGVLYSGFAVSRNITGLATGSADLETGMAQAQQSVNTLLEDRESCLIDLEGRNNELIDTSYKLTSCEAKASATQASLDTCTSTNTGLQTSLDTCSVARTDLDAQLITQKTAYSDLAKNSASGFCCSLADARNGAVRMWTISENAIVCGEGTYTVNCTTGAATM